MKNLRKKLLEINGSVIKDSIPECNEELKVNFNSGKDIASFFETEGPMDALVIDNTFEKVLNDWNLLEYMQESISRQLVNDFTEGQLACIFEVLNGECLRLDDDAGLRLKARLLNYIHTEGYLNFNLDNVEEFSAKLDSMHPLILTIQVSKIRKQQDEIISTDYKRQIIIGLSDFSKRHCQKVLLG